MCSFLAKTCNFTRFHQDYFERCLLSVNTPLPIKYGIGEPGYYPGIYLDNFFYGCSNLKYIPGKMFHAYKYTRYSFCSLAGMFSGCTSLKNIPATIFDGLPVVAGMYSYSPASIDSMFNYCSSLGSIPDELFDNEIFDNVTSATNIFRGCTSLRDISSDIFSRFSHSCTSFASAFDNCASLMSVGDLFYGASSCQDFSGVFDGCSKLESISSDLFYGCSSALKFADAFAGCSKLDSIPSRLFNDCVDRNTMSFVRCFQNCIGITSAVPELWNQFPSAAGGACFRNCTNASNYADVPYLWR